MPYPHNYSTHPRTGLFEYLLIFAFIAIWTCNKFACTQSNKLHSLASTLPPSPKISRSLFGQNDDTSKNLGKAFDHQAFHINVIFPQSLTTIIIDMEVGQALTKNMKFKYNHCTKRHFSSNRKF